MLYGKGIGCLARRGTSCTAGKSLTSPRARKSPHDARGARFVFASFQNLSKAIRRRLLSSAASSAARTADRVRPDDTRRSTTVRQAGRRRVIAPGDTARFRLDRPHARVRAALGWNGRTDRRLPLAGCSRERHRPACPRGRQPAGPRAAARRRRPRGDRLRAAVEPVARPRRSPMSRMTMLAYLNAMDVLCALSQTSPAWREQFSRMLIEVMACGVGRRQPQRRS